jgi:hypothetical protein
LVRLSRRQRVRSAEMVMAGVSSIHSGQRGDVAADFHEAVEVALADLAAADAVAGNARFLRQQTGRELVRAHFQGEDRAAAPGHGVGGPSPAPSRRMALAAPKAILVASARLAHAGPARDDHQVRRVQPAHLGIEVAQPGRQPRHAARRAERLLRMLHGDGQRPFEGHEAAIPRAALLREVEQCLFRRFELLLRVEFRLCPEGAVDHDLAEIDQLPPQIGVIDDAAIFPGIDDADHRREQLREIARPAHLIEQAGMFELRAQRHDIGKLPGFHAPLDRLVDSPMDRIGEMLGREEFRDALIGLVVGEQGAEQRLFGGEVGRRQALRKAEQAVRGRGSRRSCSSPASLARRRAPGLGTKLWMEIE